MELWYVTKTHPKTPAITHIMNKDGTSVGYDVGTLGRYYVISTTTNYVILNYGMFFYNLNWIFKILILIVTRNL